MIICISYCFCGWTFGFQRCIVNSLFLKKSQPAAASWYKLALSSKSNHLKLCCFPEEFMAISSKHLIISNWVPHSALNYSHYHSEVAIWLRRWSGPLNVSLFQLWKVHPLWTSCIGTHLRSLSLNCYIEERILVLLFRIIVRNNLLMITKQLENTSSSQIQDDKKFIWVTITTILSRPLGRWLECAQRSKGGIRTYV